MGISVNSSPWGATRMRAFERIRLIDVDERLPTKYPTLYSGMCRSSHRRIQQLPRLVTSLALPALADGRSCGLAANVEGTARRSVGPGRDSCPECGDRVLASTSVSGLDRPGQSFTALRPTVSRARPS